MGNYINNRQHERPDQLRENFCRLLLNSSCYTNKSIINNNKKNNGVRSFVIVLIYCKLGMLSVYSSLRADSQEIRNWPGIHT